MRHSHKLLWVLLCFAGSAWAAAPATAPEVAIEMLAADKLMVSYTLPPGCDAVDFLQNRETYGKVRANWQPLNACGTANNVQLQRADAACASVAFIVPTDTGHYDRVYPYAFPMGDAIYVHSSNYAIADKCGAPAYRYRAPGYVLARGELAEKSLHMPAGTKQADYTPVLLMQRAPRQDGGAIVHLDPAMSAETQRMLLDASEQTVNYLHNVLPDASYRRPALTATVVNDGQWPRYVGDAADILRLALYNWPSVSEPDSAQQVRSFVAHEFAHRFQPEALHDLKEHKVLLLEGGAEFLAWTTLIANAWATPEQAAAKLNEALARCVQGTGTAAWAALPEQQRAFGKLPYDCGFALHALSLAADPQGGGLTRFNRYYRQQDAASLARFEQQFACETGRDCRAAWLPRLLGDKEAFHAVLAEMLSQTGLAKASEPTPGMKARWLANEFGPLMAADCNGMISIHFEPDGYRIGATPQPCKTLREGMRIRAAEAVPFKDGQAVVALRTACSQQGSVSLTLAEGEPVSLSCKQPGPEPVFYAVDMPKVLTRLGIALPGATGKAK